MGTPYTPKSKSAVNNVGRTSSKKSSSKRTTSAERLDVTKNISTNIRQIENGFVVSESGYVGKGRNQKYVNKEYFSETNPVAGVKIQFGKKK